MPKRFGLFKLCTAI